MKKWILAFSLLIVAVLIAFIIFSVTGVIDAPALFWKLGLKSRQLEPHLQIYSRGLDAQTWLQSQEAELKLKAEEIENYALELKTKEEHLEQLAQELAKQEQELQRRASALEKIMEERRQIQRVAEIYMEMAPEESARILEKAEQDLALQILSWMDERNVAHILTKLPTDLAVALSKQLGQYGD